MSSSSYASSRHSLLKYRWEVDTDSKVEEKEGQKVCRLLQQIEVGFAGFAFTSRNSAGFFPVTCSHPSWLVDPVSACRYCISEAI